MTRIGRRISIALNNQQRDFSIVKLSFSLSCTAEQTRRYVRGEQLPDNRQLKLICKRLHIPWPEALHLVTLDRMQRQVKHSPINEYSDLQVICMLWLVLSDASRSHLVQTAYALSKAKTLAAAG